MEGCTESTNHAATSYSHQRLLKQGFYSATLNRGSIIEVYGVDGTAIWILPTPRNRMLLTLRPVALGFCSFAHTVCQSAETSPYDISQVKMEAACAA